MLRTQVIINHLINVCPRKLNRRKVAYTETDISTITTQASPFPIPALGMKNRIHYTLPMGKAAQWPQLQR